MTSEAIVARLTEIRARVAAAAERSDRDPALIELLPVTKGHPIQSIEAVKAAGFGAIGENRVPEAEDKQGALGGRTGLAWHLIGRLQRNKARRAVRAFDTIESVDSVKLATHLGRVAREEGHDPFPVLVQVNTSGEAGKTGFRLDEAPDAVERVAAVPGLRVDGLMMMAPFDASEAVLRQAFRKAKQLFDRCASEVPAFGGDVLSMGMSNDFEIAIEEGSTRVRLGTVLLGER